ncbi:hypothetical protein D3C76_1194670 [compost metagenome]
MGKTLATLHEIVAVVTRRRHTITVDRDDALGHLLIVARFFHSDAPGGAVEFPAGGLEFTGGFGKIVVDAHGRELRGNRVQRITGGDTVEVDFHGGVLA